MITRKLDKSTFERTTAGELLAAFKDLYPRLIDPEKEKNSHKYMQTADIDSIWIDYGDLTWLCEELIQCKSLAEAQKITSELDWQTVYFVSLRKTAIEEYLSRLPDTHPMLAPRSGRERFVWLLANTHQLQKDGTDYKPVW